MKKSMIDILTELLMRAGITWFPRKKAEFLFCNDVIKVTRCEYCRHAQEHSTPNGTVWYCPIHEHIVSSCGYCHNSEENL